MPNEGSAPGSSIDPTKILGRLNFLTNYFVLIVSSGQSQRICVVREGFRATTGADQGLKCVLRN